MKPSEKHNFENQLESEATELMGQASSRPHIEQISVLEQSFREEDEADRSSNQKVILQAFDEYIERKQSPADEYDMNDQSPPQNKKHGKQIQEEMKIRIFQDNDEKDD